MSRSVRVAVLSLCAAPLLGGCGTEDPSTVAATEPSPATARAPSAAPSVPSSATLTAVPASPSAVADDVQLVAVTVADGAVTGDTGRVEVGLGATVRLSVTSDVADEVHVHGVDLYADVAPGQASSVEFVADQPGVFEVELHDAGTVLTRLQVS